jgi:hypothetical protein
MGGGGGGRSLTPDELKSLEATAKESLREGSGEEKSNVFISFATEDINEVNLLRAQAKNENTDIEFNDWSVQEPFDSKDAEYIKRGIREKIRQSSVTIVYLSNAAVKSKWVDWEIRESIRLGKGVIAMYQGDTRPTNLPAAIIEHKVKLVTWNHDQLQAAINKVSGN